MNTIISVSLLIYAIATVVLGSFLGYRRGVLKSAVRIFTVAAAAVTGFFTARILGGVILDSFDGKSLESILEEYLPFIADSMNSETKEIISGISPETMQYIIALPVYLVLVPLIFLIVFYVIKLFTLIFYGIFAIINNKRARARIIAEQENLVKAANEKAVQQIDTKAIEQTDGKVKGKSSSDRKKKKVKIKRSLASRLSGAGIGLVQSVAIVMMVLLPFSGVLALAGEMKTVLTAEGLPDESAQAVDDFYSLYLDELTDSPILKISSTLGGKALYDALTEAELDNNKYTMSDMTITLGRLYADVAKMSDFDIMHPERNRTEINRLISDISSDEYTATLVSAVFVSAATGIEKTLDDVYKLDEPYRTLAIRSLEIFENSTKDTLYKDLTTIADTYFVFGECGVFDEMKSGNKDGITKKLIEKDENGELVIDKVIHILEANEHSAPIVDSLAEISITIMCESMEFDGNAVEVYEDIKTGVNDILSIDKEDYATNEEYTEAVETQLSETLEKHDIFLEEEVIDGMTDFIVENFSDFEGEITDAEVAQTILSYYSAYAEYLESGELPDELPEGFPEGLFPEE